MNNFLNNTITDSFMNFFNDIGVFLKFDLRVLFENTLLIERSFPNNLSGITEKINLIIIVLGTSYIILKFIKKGFDIYMVGIDGDATTSPSVLMTNFARAILSMAFFSFVFGIGVDIATDYFGRIYSTIAQVDLADYGALLAVLGGLIIGQIVIVIMLIVYTIFYFLLIKDGLQLLILRIGFPLVCSGLMDTNSGIYAPYVSTIFKVIFTIAIKLLLSQFALACIISGNPVLAIAALISAIGLPAFLNSFLVPSGGSMYQTAQMGRMAYGLFRGFGR